MCVQQTKRSKTSSFSLYALKPSYVSDEVKIFPTTRQSGVQP